MELFGDPLNRQPSGGTPYWLRPTRVSSASDTDEEQNDKYKFSLKLNVSHFEPDEISVKTAENELTITAKHEERPDRYGFVSRSFTRRYVLPKDVDSAALTSKLTIDGMLYVEARKKSAETPKERTIPIQIGAVHFSVGQRREDTKK